MIIPIDYLEEKDKDKYPIKSDYESELGINLLAYESGNFVNGFLSSMKINEISYNHLNESFSLIKNSIDHGIIPSSISSKIDGRT
jgi:hypothetical protein